MQKYKTILKETASEIERKKSRFIANVKHVSTGKEAVQFIDSLKTRYWDASHNVFAYCIVNHVITQRFSDDGEPSGTAGIPVLEVIKRTGIQNVVIVVTRYFGGILLGAGGLVRAYSKSAASCIEKSGIVTMQLCKKCSLVLQYPLLGKIQNHIHEKKYNIKDIIYTDRVEIILYIPENELEEFEIFLADATNGKINFKKYESEYIAYKE